MATKSPSELHTSSGALSGLRRVLVLGGGSDIATSFVASLPKAQSVTLAGRPGGSVDDAVARLKARLPDTASVSQADFDAHKTGCCSDQIEEINAQHGPFDTVVIAFAQLGKPFNLDIEPNEAERLATVDFAAPVASTMAAINILRGTPDARVIVFSSIAAVRSRIGNLIYGSSKAGLDVFARGVQGPAKRLGVDIVVVRPGFVHTQMTKGLDPAPMAATPEQVAQDILAGLAKGRSIIHSPAKLGPIGLVLRNLPEFVWRRIGSR